MQKKLTMKMMKSIIVCCCLVASFCVFLSLAAANEDGAVIEDKGGDAISQKISTIVFSNGTVMDVVSQPNTSVAVTNATNSKNLTTKIDGIVDTVANTPATDVLTINETTQNSTTNLGSTELATEASPKLTEVTSASTTTSTTTTSTSTSTTPSTTSTTTTTTTTPVPVTIAVTSEPSPPPPPPPPEPRQEDKNVTLVDKGAVEQEHNSSMSIFFVLMVIMIGTLLIHIMLQLPSKFQYLPDSIVVVILGALIGLILKNVGSTSWEREEVFSPTGFFLVLLPPIIFESGYNLHKGNFFQNIGSILVFAILGTTISALVIGCGIYILGLADVAYHLNFVESFAFGSLISAVDPVATVAIFHALDVDPVLNMLVFGESILNDAISIVLTTTVMPPGMSSHPSLVNSGTGTAIVNALQRFCMMFFASAAIGVFFAIMSALLLKHIDFRKHPSLEFGLMLVFTYAPYVLAEGIHLSGIMAILFCGIGMSHYTHYNLSTVTQITMQQTMRTLAFIAETCVFAYLGLAIFSFQHQVEPALVVWSTILCLVGRACNIFPLAVLVNKFREHKITHKMQFIMWFSGLRVSH